MKKKSDWELLDKTYDLISDDFFAFHVPMRVFVNIKSGELRLFSKDEVEARGFEQIIEKLNS